MRSVDDLHLAFHASALATELALTHFESRVSATLKADGSPVTEADRAVERLLRKTERLLQKTLSEARPDGALLGEELGQLGESDRVWILDPIDGTGFFMRGETNWRIHIALEVRGSTELAVVTSAGAPTSGPADDRSPRRRQAGRFRGVRLRRGDLPALTAKTSRGTEGRS